MIIYVILVLMVCRVALSVETDVQVGHYTYLCHYDEHSADDDIIIV